MANEGIGGNRVLSDVIGLSALARFDRDVLSLPNVTHLILLEGINDIGFPNFPDNKNPAPPIEASALIAAYRQMIGRAHLARHQSDRRHLGAVSGRYVLFRQQVIKFAQAVNEWIRSGGEFDAVVDFDRALRDPNGARQTRCSLRFRRSSASFRRWLCSDVKGVQTESVLGFKII